MTIGTSEIQKYTVEIQEIQSDPCYTHFRPISGHFRVPEADYHSPNLPMVIYHANGVRLIRWNISHREFPSEDVRNTEIRCGNTGNTVCSATSATSISAGRTPISLSEVSFGIYGSAAFRRGGQKYVRGRQKYRNTLWKYKKYSQTPPC